jgi:hypothetical protein
MDRTRPSVASASQQLVIAFTVRPRRRIRNWIAIYPTKPPPIMNNLQLMIYKSSTRKKKEDTAKGKFIWWNRKDGLREWTQAMWASLTSLLGFAKQKIQSKSNGLVDSFGRRQCAKYMIPQGRSYSKALGLNSEVMVEMVLLRYSKG